MKDMTLMNAEITVGHIIANPNFDVNCYVKVIDGSDQETVLWSGYGNEECPVEWLIKPVGYMTIRNDMLVIEARMQEG